MGLEWQGYSADARWGLIGDRDNVARFSPDSIASLLVTLMGATFHARSNQLPDIGTAGVAALPIEQEVRYGNAFMRFARAGLPIIDDPVLSTNTSTIWASGC